VRAVDRAEVALALTYRVGADASCPGEDAFVELVKERVPGLVRAAQDAASTAHVRIDKRPDQAGYAAEVILSDAHGLTSTRTLSAESCDEASQGAALIVAVFVSGPRSDAREPAPGEVPEHPEPQGPTARWSGTIQARAGLRTAVAPGVAPAMSGGLEVQREVQSLLAPSLRLSFTYGWGSASTSTGAVRLSLALAELDVCPLRFPAVPGRWSVRGCLRMEAGKQRGAWRSGPREARGGPWLAPGASARTAVRVAGCVSAALEAGVSLPLVQNRFLDGDHVVYAVPKAAFAGSLAVGCTIW
jgi:hypothetical protein